MSFLVERWNECNYLVDPETLKGRFCYGGLDLSFIIGITAFVLVFPPEDEDDKFQVIPFFWISEEILQQRVTRDHFPYDIWHKQDIIRITG